MKFFSMFLALAFLFSCTTNTQEKNPIEGTWEMISGEWSTPDTTYLFPVTDYERYIIMHSRTHTIYIYQDTSQKDYNSFGGGKYTLEGDKYSENIEFFDDPEWIGKSINYTIKVRRDTMWVSGTHPLKKWGFGEYDMDLYEVYKRID